MMQEVVQLRQEHLMTVQKMDALNQRMQSTEVRQKQQMVSFLGKLLQNPVFLSRLKQLKEQRGIASMRSRRKFLKQQQHLSSAIPYKPMDQQIVKGFWDASALASIFTVSGERSGALLPVFDQSEGKQLPDHLLQDVDKLGLETHGQDIFGPSNESKDIKGKNMLSSQMEADFGGSDYFIFLPDEVTSEEIVPENICPTGLTVSKGKDIVNLKEDDISADSGVGTEYLENFAEGTEYLENFAEDISQGGMFPVAITPASDCVGEEGIWNIGLDTGGSSLSPGDDVWDSLGDYHAQEMKYASGSCHYGGLGFHNLEQYLHIDRYVSDDSSLQEHKDGGWTTE